MDVLHTAIDVGDLDAMREFYEGFLGLEHTRDFTADGVQNYYVGGAGPAEIQFRVVDDPSTPSGIHHIAVACEDVDATVESAVSSWNSDVVREPQTLERLDVRIAFITDPEGYTVELIEEL